MQKGEIQKLIGFLLFIMGMLSLILLMVGANFSYLTWMDAWGKLAGLLIRIGMVGLGIVLSYFAWLEESRRR